MTHETSLGIHFTLDGEQRLSYILYDNVSLYFYLLAGLLELQCTIFLPVKSKMKHCRPVADDNL